MMNSTGLKDVLRTQPLAPELFVESAKERLYIEEKYQPLMVENVKLARLVSYVGNKSIPILGLYRFKEAFSLGLVNYLLDRFEAGPNDVVFDPFSGMGTTLFASMLRGIPSFGVEKLPVAAFVARTLPMFLSLEPGCLSPVYQQLKRILDTLEPEPVADDVAIMKIAFNEQTLTKLRKWKTAINTLNSPMREVFQLLFLGVLESTSFVSNDGQFLRHKPNKKTLTPDEALLRKVLQSETDLITIQHSWFDKAKYLEYMPAVYEADARNLDNIQFSRKPTILITSPPYPNRYDYTRSYCLELCFNFVRNFNELKMLRYGILRSHIESREHEHDKPAHEAIAEVLFNLSMKKLNNPRIPIMLNAYFVDMEKCIKEWARILQPGARVAMVVDNVRFEGELVPVDLILSDLAERHEFQVQNVVVARYKGNSSQQMGRYGRVPVRESIVVWSKL